MTLSISKRTNKIIQSDIRTMSIECDKVNGVNLSQGVCDLALPAQLVSGASEAIKRGINSYTRYDGLVELRDAIANKTLTYNKIDADPERNITVSSGSTGAFYSACLALLDPGDEVILFEPYYGYHVNTLLSVEAVIKYVKMTPPDWSFKIDDLEKAITPKTKAIMINTPVNPCGKVFSRDELRSLAEFCNRHDLIVFTDEIYEYIVYDGREHISPGSLPEISDRTITISGYSKTFSITGWRIGYCVCKNEEISQAIGFINDLVYVCAPAPLQAGVAYAINSLDRSFYSNLVKTYHGKRDMICGALNRAGLEPHVPQGAYYVLADVSRLPGSTSKERSLYLLHKTGVASVPGNAFYHGSDGDNFVRFCFAKGDSVLEDACERLSRLRS